MKNLKEIRSVLTNNYHGMKLTDKDLEQISLIHRKNPNICP